MYRYKFFYIYEGKVLSLKSIYKLSIDNCVANERLINIEFHL